MAPSIPRLVRFRLQAIIDVGLAPQLAKPIVERRPLAPLAQYLARLHPLVLFFNILGTPPQNLNTVPAKPGLNRLANLDRTSVVSGKSVSVRVDRGGRRIINK